MAVLRMGSWARLHPDVKEVTLEDQVNRVRGRVKHENSAQREVQALEEKLKGLHVTKQTLSNQLDSLEETVRAVEKGLNLSSTIC